LKIRIGEILKVVQWSHYATATPKNIKIVPTENLTKSFKVDYEDRTKSMIIGNSLSYEELLEILDKIQSELYKSKSR